jgi:phospholipase/carboxylesterase
VLILRPIGIRRTPWLCSNYGGFVDRRYGPDAASIDRALEQTFSCYAIDPVRLAIGGFSDGASYALSLGITNGDLFTHVIAFTRVLPIDRCSRRIVPGLERCGYDVLYREFDGGHTILPEIASVAVGWFTQVKFP